VRSHPVVELGDPPIEWLLGDLRDPETNRRAVRGVRAVVHAAGWVALGADPAGDARAVNVDVTGRLLDCAEVEGVERFLFTSSLWTVARGTRDAPADEASAWNLDRLRSPYCETKREAERLVLARARPGFGTAALCPGLVIGPRDVRPTSTGVLLAMARQPVLFLPRGGIPVVDARILAMAHRRALARAEPGRRYVIAGPYLSYLELAALVARVSGRPKIRAGLPDELEPGITALASLLGRWGGGRASNISVAAIAGAFLRLHVSGECADTLFELRHPDPVRSVFDAMEDHRRSGRAPWLKLREPPT
jgi:dihydroflavonol-4-reductase